MKFFPSTPASAARSASTRTTRASARAEMRFAVYEPPQARARPRAGAVLPRRPHLHRRDVHDQGRRAAPRRRARPDAGRARHEPARAAPAGRRRELGLRPRRRLLRRRDAGAVVGALPHVQLRHARAAGSSSPRTSPRDAGRQAIFGHSMGGHGALVCALRNPDRYRSVSAFAPIVAPSQVPVGPQGVRRLPRRERARWPATMPASSSPSVTVPQPNPHRPGARRTSSSPSSCARMLFAAACRARASPWSCARARGLRPRLLLHPDLHGGPSRVACRGADRGSVTAVLIPEAVQTRSPWTRYGDPPPGRHGAGQ